MQKSTFYTFLLYAGLLCFEMPAAAQANSENKSNLIFETLFHTGYIVRNSGDVPSNSTPFLITLNPAVQTGGSEPWHQYYGFPRAGLKITFASLGNRNELGYMAGITPNLTLKTSPENSWISAVNLGLGLAWFNKPYNMVHNPRNFYIGSPVTALAEASVQTEPRLSEHTSLIAGIRVIHCSNSHFQVPNLGMNLISVYAGILWNSGRHYTPAKQEFENPPSRLRLNIRSGIGIHELARTLGPAGTPKYTIYVNDLYLSKRFGKISNVHAGIGVSYYKSFYNYIVTNSFFESNPHFNATVVSVFLAHEFMIGRFSLLTQGGINVHNKFYNRYIAMYKSEKGLSTELKKIFPSRLGLQYYFRDPQYTNGSNIFIGAYIKANFGQADYACFQAGVVF